MTDARTNQSAEAAQTSPTVGVLYAGELGASLAALLRTRGLRAVTTLGDRGPATAQRCREVGLVVLDSLADVIRQSDVVISLVPPAAAGEVAAAYCDLAHLAPASALYVDANSISPDLAASLAATVERRGRAFVDAAINGLAKNLAKGGTLYLSGARAGDVARLFDGALRVHVLGDEPGKASAMKMLLSGLSKGVCALFTELACLADRQRMLPELIEASARIYPGIWALVERMLPTYPQHAARRATEMRELEQTAQSAGLEPCAITAIREMHERLAGVPFDTAPDAGGWTVASLVRELAENRMLTPDPSAAEQTLSAD